LRSIAGAAVEIVVVFLLLSAPDLFLHYKGFAIHPFVKKEYFLTIGIFSVLFALSAGTWFRMAVIVLILLNQTIWLCSLVYFGAPLTPEQVQLFFSDTADSVTTGAHIESQFVMPLLTALAPAVLLGLISIFRPFRGSRSAVFSVVLALALVGVVARWSVHGLPAAIQAGSYSASATAATNVGVLAMRETEVAAPPSSLNPLADHTIAPVPVPEGKATVVMVMGESINPARLSIFGWKRATTPGLAHFLNAPPPGWHMMAKIGFSGGVATLASVPSALRLVYFPNLPDRQPMNIFDVANTGDFKSYYYSAQAITTMQIAGGARHVLEEKTVETYDEKAEMSPEESLAEDVKGVPPAPRRFIYVHQRADHEPYLDNCKKYVGDFRTFEAPDGSDDEARRARYDTGLQCWDRSTSDIIQAFLGEKDPVYVFVTSDHNELMGEGGYWGHLIRHLPTAVVPVILMTNRPDSAIAAEFQRMDRPTQFQLMQLVAEAMGSGVNVKQYDPSIFYVNGTMPFGRAKYMEVEKLPGDRYRVSHFSSDATPAEPSETVSLESMPKDAVVPVVQSAMLHPGGSLAH